MKTLNDMIKKVANQLTGTTCYICSTNADTADNYYNNMLDEEIRLKRLLKDLIRIEQAGISVEMKTGYVRKVCVKENSIHVMVGWPGEKPKNWKVFIKNEIASAKKAKIKNLKNYNRLVKAIV